MPFGFAAAPGIVEMAIFKFLYTSVEDEDLKAILDIGRFADNITAWGLHMIDLNKRGNKLEELFSSHSLFFKDGVEPHRQLSVDDVRRKSKSEAVYGYVWDLELDNIGSTMEISVHSKKRGNKVKPSLDEKLPEIGEIS